MTLDPRQLNAFLAIVDHGSLGRAAEALHITQPALSRTIKRLEGQLGAALFDRYSKGMALSAIGHALLPHARLLQRETAHAEEEIRAMRGLAKGTIRVGAIGSVASLALPLAIGRVLQQWPQLQVQVLEGVWDRLADALVRHEIDLALDVEKPDGDEIVGIADCHWEDMSYVVAAPAHPLQRKRRLQLADTLDQRWAMPPRGTGPFEHLQQVFRAQGLAPPEIAVETRSITVLKSLIMRAGFLGWMAEPIWDAERSAGQIKALPLRGVVGSRRLTAFRRRQGLLPGPAARLVDALRAGT
ncbi:LysR family transcriptional regulator [Aquabacterium sp.]|uniref:LysR family transcriptional regulator n=1 Tax=Aquabacterium sp. TaxID=1872578 RepID=UPI002D09F4C9|nr:LysR family transcriptional regulator [Aquabacterium sp.]HSW06516.1 LysR family transcriptional regulator [Aquabacterium sp.]